MAWSIAYIDPNSGPSSISPPAGSILMPGASSVLGATYFPVAGGILMSGSAPGVTATGPLVPTVGSILLSGSSPILTTSGGPLAPTGVHMTLQGQTSASNTPSPPTPSAPNSTTIGWTQGAAGTYPISYNKVYRSTTSASSGFSLLYTSATPITTYTDNAATLSVSATQGSSIPYYAANTYWYKVSAVDTNGTESPLSTTQSFVQYQNGTQNWNIDYSAAATINFNDTTGVPQGGTADISVTITGAYGLFQPVSSNLTTQWNMWGGAFSYLEFDLKSAVDRSWAIHCLRVGDVTIYNTSVGVSNAVAIAPYGTFVANQWVHYKIPMSVFLMDYGATAGVPGAPAVENAVYKWAIQDQSGATGQVWYMDNIIWTP